MYHAIHRERQGLLVHNPSYKSSAVSEQSESFVEIAKRWLQSVPLETSYYRGYHEQLGTARNGRFSTDCS
jgi:hypothetical protein